MSKTRPVFLLTGFASEYSLKGIADLLRNEGEHVVEVDFSIRGIPELDNVEVVLITSQHPARTRRIFQLDYGTVAPYDQYLSPMECMARLNVQCAVLIPHDLEQPIISDEIGYLPFFDIYCSPYDINPGLSTLCRVLPTGWAKHIDISINEFPHQSNAATNGVFCVNQLTRLKQLGGAAYLLQAYACIVENKIPFKLPCWPGVADLENELRNAGAYVIPSDTTSTQVISQSARVLSNATGSILAEAAYLGVPAHILAPHSSFLPSITPRRPARRHFDFPLLMQGIRDCLDSKGIS